MNSFPPIRFRSVGTPSFFLSHIRPALFAGVLSANPGDSFERNVTNAGFQVDLQFTVAHRLPMTYGLYLTPSQE